MRKTFILLSSFILATISASTILDRKIEANASGTASATVDIRWDFPYIGRQLGIDSVRDGRMRLDGTRLYVTGVTQLQLDTVIAGYTSSAASADSQALQVAALSSFRGITAEELARALIRSGIVSSGTLVTHLRAIRGL